MIRYPTVCLGLLLWTGLATADSAPPDSALAAQKSAWIQEPDGIVSPLIPESRPYGLGERMDFIVSYGLLDIGEAEMEIRSEREIRGHPVLEITNQARSASWVDRIFKIRDRVQSFMDRDRFFSLGFRKQISEGRYKREVHADYLQEQGIARYSDGEAELVKGSHDILTALYLIRTVKLEPGMRLGIPLHDDKKNYQVEVDVLRRETIETKLGEMDCVVLEPKLQSGGIFNKAGRLWIWISEDDRRLIVQLKSKAPVGAFTSLLTGYRPPE